MSPLRNCREVEVQKASDSVDRSISLFNNTATKLSLVGPSNKYPMDVISDQFKCITFTPHALTADKMVNCSMKQNIKPSLLKLKDYLLEKAKSLHDKYMDTHMQLEAVLEAVEEKREAVNALEAKLQKHLNDYRTGKHAVAEAVKRGRTSFPSPSSIPFVFLLIFIIFIVINRSGSGEHTAGGEEKHRRGGDDASAEREGGGGSGSGGGGARAQLRAGAGDDGPVHHGDAGRADGA